MRIARTWKNLASLVLVQPIRMPVLFALYAVHKSLERLSWLIGDAFLWLNDHTPGLQFERTQMDIDAEKERHRLLVERYRGVRQKQDKA